MNKMPVIVAMTKAPTSAPLSVPTNALPPAIPAGTLPTILASDPLATLPPTMSVFSLVLALDQMSMEPATLLPMIPFPLVPNTMPLAVKVVVPALLMSLISILLNNLPAV